MNLLDYPFVNTCPKETSDAASQWLKDNRDEFFRLGNGSMTAFAVFFKNGNVSQRPKAVCHGSMSGDQAGDRLCISTEIGTHRMGKVGPSTDTAYPEGLYAPYVHWLTQESVYSRFIINRDDPFFCLQYGIVISADIPTEYMINLLIMSRMIVEANPFAFEFFNELISEGYPGSVAYQFAFHTQNSVWGTASRPYKFESTSPRKRSKSDFVYSHLHHRPTGLAPSVGALRAFCGGLSTFSPADTYKIRATTLGGSSVFEGERTSGNVLRIVSDTAKRHPEFVDLLRINRNPSEVKEAVVVNPFVKSATPPSSPLQITYEEVQKVLLPFLRDKGYFNNAIH